MKLINELDLHNCHVCPRDCGTNRYVNPGAYCQIDKDYYIASIVIHYGEEPPISGSRGICNVFFAHCNLQCVYCQNYQISRNKVNAQIFAMSYEKVLDTIISILDKGIPSVGFVSPSHVVTQMIEIVEGLHKRGYYPTIVYNSNGYDKLEVLLQIEGLIDVYLPDLKYMDNELGRRYSKVRDYVQVASLALKEMYRQKGTTVLIDDEGYAYYGLIVRHLVLPNNIENSFAVLDFIARELSVKTHVSLMSQYYPTADAFKYPELSRSLKKYEYNAVLEYMNKLGFVNGWIQDIESNITYRPDFEKDNPFEH